MRVFGVPISRGISHSSTVPPDLLSLVGLMFAFARGSTRYISYCNNSATVSTDLSAAEPVIFNGCMPVDNQGVPTFAMVQAEGEPLRFELPYYSNYKNMNIRAMQSGFYNTNDHYPAAR